MRKVIFAFAVALCFGTQAQNIEESKMDKATKQYSIITKTATLFKGNIQDATDMEIGFYSTGNIQYISLTGTSHYRLTLKDKITFQFQNDSTVTISFAKPQSAEYSSPSYNLDFSFIVTASNIQLFSNSPLKSVQIYTTSDPINRDINKNKANEIMDIANSFQNEYSGKVSKSTN